MVTTIVIRRTGALGDVVLTTPIVRHLRKVIGPDAELHVQTAYPDVFIDNPHVTKVFAPHEMLPFDATLISLDLAYEWQPTKHPVAAYSDIVESYGFPPVPMDARLQEMFPPDWTLSGKTAVAVHAARSWPSRTLPMSFWLDLCGRIRSTGIRPIFVGTQNDQMYGPACDRPLPETAAFLACCTVLIASDSSLIHVAGAVGCPVVGLFTSVRPEYRMPIGGPGTAFTPEGLECGGCLERAPIPTTSLQTCERGDNACIWRFDAQAVVDAAKELAKAKKAEMRAAFTAAEAAKAASMPPPATFESFTTPYTETP